MWQNNFCISHCPVALFYKHRILSTGVLLKLNPWFCMIREALSQHLEFHLCFVFLSMEINAVTY